MGQLFQCCKRLSCRLYARSFYLYMADEKAVDDYNQEHGTSFKAGQSLSLHAFTCSRQVNKKSGLTVGWRRFDCLEAAPGAYTL